MLKKILFGILGLSFIFVIAGCKTNETSTIVNPTPVETEKKEYTVIFNTLGGNLIESKKVEEGKAIDLPTAPTKEGYTFDGWFTDESLSTKYNQEPVLKNMTLYAKWNQDSVVVAPLAKTTVYMIGDSTCAPYDQTTKDLDYYYQRDGFGTGIASYFKEEATVVNLGVGGASSKSYTTLSQYTQFTTDLKEGDYVIIAFGHNDEKKADSTKFATLENNGKDNEGTFSYYIYNNFIKFVLEKKATPILATPIVRYDSKNEYAQGSKYLHCMQEDTTFGGGDYAQAVRDLADELGLTLIDNTNLTASKWKATTDGSCSRDYYGMISSNAEDGTHLNSYGALMVGYLMVQSLITSNSPLGKYVKEEIKEPTKEEYLIVNPNYVEPTYKAPTAWSSIWTTTNDWHASVFGALRHDPKKNFTTYYEIKENSNGTVVLDDKGTGSTDNYATGQFNSKKDGILMYFKQVSINDNFVFEATLHLDSIQYVNNAAGFGLMVRDDMYIDTYKADLSTNFIAVGNLGAPFAATSASPYTYKAFQRENSDGLTRLSNDKTNDYLKEGESVNLKIVKVDSTYSLFYNNEKTSGNYDLSLAGDDKVYIYVGLFVAGVTATFSNISLTIN
ncbi:MAG: InlB B-repeat-containing protein [Anaeroplasma bactoclasticum]|nr:InlB B-repeat-containing protein [Anaeroplasma bactoclasticum]